MDMRQIDIFFKISNPRQCCFVKNYHHMFNIICKICEGEIVFYYKCKNKNNFRFAILTKQSNNQTGVLLWKN